MSSDGFWQLAADVAKLLAEWESSNNNQQARQVLSQRFAPFYRAIGNAIGPTQQAIRILDLGTGTGIELDDIFHQAPNALVSCVDTSAEMLEELRRTFSNCSAQLELVEESFIDLPFPPNQYHYVVSVMAMHHYTYDQKQHLYERIKESLKKGGKFILGDFLVSPEAEHKYLTIYQQKLTNRDVIPGQAYHIDIPFSFESEKQVLFNSGFDKIEIYYEAENTGVIAAS